jgi:hypothetical protein
MCSRNAGIPQTIHGLLDVRWMFFVGANVIALDHIAIIVEWGRSIWPQGVPKLEVDVTRISKWMGLWRPGVPTQNV